MGETCAWPKVNKPCGNPARGHEIPLTYGGSPMMVGATGLPTEYQFRGKGLPVSEPVPLCGVHLNANRRRRDTRDQQAAERERAREADRRRGYAVNLAALLSSLTDQQWSSMDDGRGVGLSVADAEKMYRELAAGS